MEYTIAILKPNVIENRQMGEVLRLMGFWGFTVEDMRYYKSAPLVFVKEFYGVHKDKPFYDRLTNGMADRPWLAIKLGHRDKTVDVIESWRKWLKQIRKEYSGQELHDNAVHGSDSEESAKAELKIIFGE